MDLARDAGAFGERRELDFVVLTIGKVAVARLERESSFLQLVADGVAKIVGNMAFSRIPDAHSWAEVV